MKQLPDKLKLAIARYYVTRAAHKQPAIRGLWQELSLLVIGSATSASIKEVSFDKDAILKNIEAVAHKYKFGFSACAGTMWFRRRLRSGNVLMFEIHEFDYLDSGARTIAKRKMAMVAL